MAYKKRKRKSFPQLVCNKNHKKIVIKLFSQRGY